MRPAYLKLAESGELAKRVALAWRHLEDCDLCARYCRSSITAEISANTCVNIMDQYRPCYRADDNPPLDRLINSEEFSQALAWADDAGLRRLA